MSFGKLRFTLSDKETSVTIINLTGKTVQLIFWCSNAEPTRFTINTKVLHQFCTDYELKQRNKHRNNGTAVIQNPPQISVARWLYTKHIRLYKVGRCGNNVFILKYKDEELTLQQRSIIALVISPFFKSQKKKLPNCFIKELTSRVVRIPLYIRRTVFFNGFIYERKAELLYSCSKKCHFRN